MSLAQVLLGAAARTKVSPRFAPMFSQAANEALVRFGPQWDLLNQAREASAQQMHQRVQQANIAGAMMADAANRSASTLANAPAPSVSFAGPPTSSSAVVAQNLGQTRENTLGMLTTAARNAPVFSAQQALQARTAHEQKLADIQGSRASLANQIGAYTTGRVNDLVGSDRKLRHDANQAAAKLKASFIQAGVDPTTGKVVPGGPKDPAVTHPPKPPPTPSAIAKPPSNFTGSPADWNTMSRTERDAWVSGHPTGKAKAGVPNPGNIQLLPPGQQSTQVSKINSAFANVKDLMGKPNAQKHEVELLLRAGKVDGVKYTQPQIDVAFDLLRNNGQVSNRGAHRLHTIGVSVGGHFRPARPRSPSVSTGLGGGVPLPPGV